MTQYEKERLQFKIIKNKYIMNTSAIKTALLFISMIALLIMACITKDAINSNLFAGVSIIIWAFASHNLSTEKQINNE